MANVNVLNQNGEVVSNVELNDSVWAIEPNQQAMFDAVMVYRASTRQANLSNRDFYAFGYAHIHNPTL